VLLNSDFPSSASASSIRVRVQLPPLNRNRFSSPLADRQQGERHSVQPEREQKRGRDLRESSGPPGHASDDAFRAFRRRLCECRLSISKVIAGETSPRIQIPTDATASAATGFGDGCVVGLPERIFREPDTLLGNIECLIGFGDGLGLVLPGRQQALTYGVKAVEFSASQREEGDACTCPESAAPCKLPGADCRRLPNDESDNAEDGGRQKRLAAFNRCVDVHSGACCKQQAPDRRCDDGDFIVGHRY
jgi:hypothetical protein